MIGMDNLLDKMAADAGIKMEEARKQIEESLIYLEGLTDEQIKEELRGMLEQLPPFLKPHAKDLVIGYITQAKPEIEGDETEEEKAWLSGMDHQMERIGNLIDEMVFT